MNDAVNNTVTQGTQKIQEGIVMAQKFGEVAIEYLVVLGGLGSLVSDLYDRYNIPGMYAAILAVIAVTVVFFKLATGVERWLRPM